MKTNRKFLVRIDPDTHRRLKIESARLMMSMTDFTNEVINRGLQRKEKRERHATAGA
jgi:predicted HicB family RNase H-like nuclease